MLPNTLGRRYGQLSSDDNIQYKSVAYVTFSMTALVDWLNDFRGTRTAQAISAAIFLGLGLYNLAFSPGTSTLWIGIPFTILGIFMIYKILLVPNNV